MSDDTRIEKEIKFGWKPQLPDFRDIPLHTSFIKSPADLPPNYDPTGIFISGENKWMPCYDQGSLGSCVYNTMAALVEFWCKKTQYKWTFMPSRLFGYYNGRAADGNVNEDCGDTIRNGIKSIAKYGVCPEDGNPAWSWAYDIKRFKEKPPEPCYKDALLHCALEYQSVPQQSDAIKSLLVQDIPIAFGFTVYSSFMNEKTANYGVMSVPKIYEVPQGGHAVTLIGYLSNFPAGTQGIKEWAIVRNSWGHSDKNGKGGWGYHGSGVFLMPWKEVLLNSRMSSDFWALTSVGFKSSN